MKSSCCVLVAWFLCFVSLGRAQLLNEGDECTLEDGLKGVCKSAEECTAPPEEIICGDEFPNPCISTTICCRYASGVDINTIAGIKCLEYAKLVYEVVPGVLINEESKTRPVCYGQQEALIVSGEPAGDTEFPHMVALGYGKNPNAIHWSCGGSLISERFVLTAGHCLHADPVNVFGEVRWARLGALHQKGPEVKKDILLSVIEYFKHPEYDKGNSVYNDIALLKLKTDVIFTTAIRPACLNTILGNPKRQPKATATGWGLTDYSTKTKSNVLMKVDLVFQPESNCNDTFQERITRPFSDLKMGILPDSMICAGDPDGTKDTCGGDSGGPLQFKLDPDPYCMYTIVGVTSFGVKECGTRGKPAVYTRVSHYIEWIEGIVWPKYKTIT